MSSRCFIVDEWLFHPEDKEMTLKYTMFLEKLLEKCDKIGILERSSWVRKMFDIYKNTEDPVENSFKSYLVNKIFYNSDKCIKKEETNLPKSLNLKSVNRKDRYLAKAYFLTGADCIITTDSRLKDELEKIGIKSFEKEEFLSDYLSE